MGLLQAVLATSLRRALVLRGGMKTLLLAANLTMSPAGPSEIVLPDVGTEAPLHSQEEAQLGCHLSRLGFGNRDHLLPSNG